MLFRAVMSLTRMTRKRKRNPKKSKTDINNYKEAIWTHRSLWAKPLGKR